MHSDPALSSVREENVTVRAWSAIDRFFSQPTLWTTVVLFLAAGYVILVPSVSPLTPLDLYNDKRFLQVGLLSITGGVLLLSSKDRQQWLDTLLRLPSLARAVLGTILGLSIISSAVAPAWSYAALETAHFFLLFGLAGVVATATRMSPRFTSRFLAGAVVLSAFLYAIHFSVSYAMSIVMPELEVGRESIGGFANIRHFNQYQTWTLPLLVGAAGTTRWRTGRMFILLLAGIWWCLMLASDVRGTTVALALASVAVWGIFRQQAHRWLGMHATALVLGGVLYLLLFSVVGGASPDVVERMGNLGSDSWRIERWKSTLELSLAYPWLGAGPMHFAWPPYHFEAGAHPHNAFLQWLAEFGIPSTALATYLVVWGGTAWIQVERKTIRQQHDSLNTLRIGLVAALLAGAAHAMVSGIIVMPVSQVLLALLGGWAWGRFQCHRSQAVHAFSGVKIRRLVLCCALVLSLASLSAGIFDLKSIDERRRSYLEAGSREAYWPRYWQQGYIGVRDSSVIRRARHDR